MNIRQLEYLIALDHSKNYTYAAEKLYVTPSAIIHFISKLEEEIGAPLFSTKDGVLTPTKIGKIYVNMAQKMLIEYNQAMNDVQEALNHNISGFTVAASTTFADSEFSKIYSEFRKKYPDVNVNINLRLFDSEIVKQVSSGIANLGIVNSNSYKVVINPGDAPLVYKKVAQEPVLFVTPLDMDIPEDILSNPYKPVDLSRFRDCTFFLPLYGSIITDIFDAHGFFPEKAEYVPTAIAAYTFAQNGDGVALVRPSSILDKTKIRYFHINPPCYTDYHIVYRKNTKLSEPEKYFISLRKKFFSEQIGWAERERIEFNMV